MERNYDVRGRYVADGFCRYCRSTTPEFDNICYECKAIPLPMRSTHGDRVQEIRNLSNRVESLESTISDLKRKLSGCQ
jgi:hypothetical protein